MNVITWNQPDNFLWVVLCDTFGRTIAFCLMAYNYWIISIGKVEAKLREHIAIDHAS
jgi:hypothetical protein